MSVFKERLKIIFYMIYFEILQNIYEPTSYSLYILFNIVSFGSYKTLISHTLSSQNVNTRKERIKTKLGS